MIKDEITSYAWLPTHSMWADILTKDKKVTLELEDILIKNRMDLRKQQKMAEKKARNVHWASTHIES